jgi:hypothetical protein
MTNAVLIPGQALVRQTSNNTLVSPSGNHVLVMQDDGNCCLYNAVNGKATGNALWCATINQDGQQLVMQDDGNLVLYNNQGTSSSNAIWASNTVTNISTLLYIQDDGNLVLYTQNTANAVWASGTNS